MPKLPIVTIVAISLLFFSISAFLLKGSLNDKTALGKEIYAPAEDLQYNISKKAPFKHRILFPAIIKRTYELLKDGENSQLFYNIYIFWSALFYIGAALSFFFLLKAFQFESVYTWIGVFLFLVSPAILSAYAYPIHTKEDMLGYMLINLCLIFIAKNKFWGIYLFSILGTFCRETLVLIPLIYFIYVDSRKGFYVLLSCIIVFLILRFGMGDNHYEILELGLLYNLRSMGQPIGFLFLVFSFLWIPFLYDLFKTFKLKTELLPEPLSILRKSSLLAFLLVFTTTFLAGRFNEIRLMFILFPWVISIFLYYLRAYSNDIVNLVKEKRFIWYAIIGGLFFTLVGIGLYDRLNLFFDDPNIKFPHSQWMLLSCFYFYITFLCLPFYKMILKDSRGVLVGSR